MLKVAKSANTGKSADTQMLIDFVDRIRNSYIEMYHVLPLVFVRMLHFCLNVCSDKDLLS